MNISHRNSGNYLNSDDKKLIFDTTLKITTNWHKEQKINKFLNIDEINFGWLLEYELYYHLLHNVIKIFYTLIKIQEEEKPKQVITSQNFFKIVNLIYKDSIIEKFFLKEIHHQKFRQDVYSIKYNVVNIPITVRIPRKYFFTIRSIYEKFFLRIYAKFFSKFESDKKSILLLDFNPALYEKFLSELSKLNLNILLLNRRRVAIWNLQSFNVVSKTKCIPVDYGRILDSYDKKKIDEYNDEVTQRLNKIFQNDDFFKNYFSIKNKSFWPSMRNYFISYCQDRFKEGIYEMIGSRKLFEKFKPSLILHFYESSLQEKVIIREGRKQNTPSILVQHGTPFLSFPDLISLTPITGYRPFYDDKKIAVWGNVMKKFVMDSGLKEENIVVTGSMKHDSFFETINKTHENEKVILVALGAMPPFNVDNQSIETYDNYVKCLEVICETIKKINCKKIVKLHPGDITFDTVVVEPIIKKIDPTIQIIVETDLIKLIKSSSIVITVGLTTFLLDSNILKKPTITLVYDKQDFLSANSNGYAELFSFSDKPKFEKYLRKILTNSEALNQNVKKGSEFVKNYLEHPSYASEYFAKIISEQLS